MIDYKGQFLLCKKELDDLVHMKSSKFDDFILYYHHTLSYLEIKTKNNHFILLGDIFNCQNPEWTNKECFGEVSTINTIEELFESIKPFYGEYVLIAKINNQFIVFNDACAQYEIYYTSDCNAFASQISLLKRACSVKKSRNESLMNYYNSNEFNNKRIFIGTTTPYENVLHLQPNHYVDIVEQNVKRFFPLNSSINKPLEEVAKQVALMLKGYLKAISNRHKLKLAVTAGYDSRVLFLASLQVECEYFIRQHPKMTELHYDIKIAKQLTDIYDKPLEIIKDKEWEEADFDKNYKQALDYPRYQRQPDVFDNNSVLINGNISEIGRSYFGNFESLSGKKLNFLNGYKIHPFVTQVYHKWLKDNLRFFKEKNYVGLDMFYWEEKMGNWTAKAKTESRALGINMMSPFNSRLLLELLLSVDKKYRDNFNNVLYDKIIFYLSNGNEAIAKLPINPSQQRQRFLLLKKLRLFNMFQSLRFIKKCLFK